MWACASIDEYYVFLAGLFLHSHVSILRRIQTGMEVEEHSVTCTRWPIILRSSTAMNNLNMSLRSCAHPSWGRHSSFRALSSTWAIIVCFEGILVVLMLLLPWWMVSRWRLSNDASLNLVLIVRCLTCWNSISRLYLLNIRSPITILVSRTRLICSCCSDIYIIWTLYCSGSKLLLSLVHHVMMLDLICSHRGSYLHSLLIHWGLRCIDLAATLNISTDCLMLVDSLNPRVTVKFTCRWPKFWLNLEYFCQDCSWTRRHVVRYHKLAFHDLLIEILVILASEGEASAKECKK